MLCRSRSVQDVLGNRGELSGKCLIQLELPPKGGGGLARLTGPFQKKTSRPQSLLKTKAVLRHVRMFGGQLLAERQITIGERLRLRAATSRVQPIGQFMN